MSFTCHLVDLYNPTPVMIKIVLFLQKRWETELTFCSLVHKYGRLLFLAVEVVKYCNKQHTSFNLTFNSKHLYLYTCTILIYEFKCECACWA
jgi:hypothetical protein